MGKRHPLKIFNFRMRETGCGEMDASLDLGGNIIEWGVG
jgi:hypothetical protein